MTKPNSQCTLYVDLDGTLLKTDWMLEAILALLRKTPLALFTLVAWLLKGRAVLKQNLASTTNVNLDLLPVNPEFLEFLIGEKKNKRKLVLISASDQTVVDAIAQRFSLFDEAIGSDGTINLKSQAKLNRIKTINEGGPFAYAGNSNADLVLWQSADEIIVVNAEATVSRQADQCRSVDSTLLEFDSPESLQTRFLRAMRPHQWLKNGLLFLPLILSHQLNQPGLLFSTLLAFISFSLCASSVYLLNDMLDIESDRQHSSKSKRPFAAGTLALEYGFLGAPALLLASLLIATLVGTTFITVLLGYWLTTCLYSFYLKRVYLLDAFTLALLFTLRIMAGSAAIQVTTTDWLIAFSGFLFLGLALLKRTTELRNLINEGQSASQGRGYQTSQLPVVVILGIMSSLASILVFMVYINAPETTELYSSPTTLWAICPLLLGMLARVWRKAYRGTLDEDPVLFASHDKPSQLMLFISGVILWMAI